MANPRAPQGPAHPELHQSGQRKGKGDPPTFPLFWKCLDAGRPVTREVTTLYSPCCQPRGLSPIRFGPLAPTRDGPAVPVLASFAVARGPISALVLRSQLRTLGQQPGARIFPLVATVLRVPGRADTGVGGAKSLLRAGRGWRLLRWNRPMLGLPGCAIPASNLAANARSRLPYESRFPT